LLFASQVVPMHPWVVLPLLLVGAMVVTGLIGLLLERFAYRSLYQRGATRLGPLISAIGASIFLQNAVMLIVGAREKVYMTYAIFPRTWRFSVDGVNVSMLVVVIVGISFAMMLGLNWLVQRTWLGRSIRAVAEDREMAAVMGIDVWRVVALTFCIGSALGGAAGVLMGFYYTQVDFYMGYAAGLKAFTAAVLGGIGNVRGGNVGWPVPRCCRKPGHHLHQPGIQGCDRLCGSDPRTDVPPWRDPGRGAARLEAGLTPCGRCIRDYSVWPCRPQWCLRSLSPHLRRTPM
jgi:branched-chain amino acid transport system permease protein